MGVTARGRLAWLAAGLVVLAAGLLVFDSLRWVVRAWSPVPFWDQWDSLAEYIRFKTVGPSLSELVRPHNEHRLVFPRLIFLMDYDWFGFGNRLLLPLCAAIQAGHALLLAGIGRPGGRLRDPAYLMVAALVFGLLFQLQQMENLFWGFQVQFVGVYALATGAFHLLGRAVDRRAGGQRWAAAYLGGLACLVVGAFSMANGIVAAPIALVLLLARRADWRLSAGVALTGAVIAALFFRGYAQTTGGSGGSVTDLIKAPLEALEYLGVLLGGVAAPFLRNTRYGDHAQTLAAVTGYVGMVLAALAFVQLVVSRERRASQYVLVAVMLFVGVSACATAAGRMAFFGVFQALSSRYATPAGVFWAALAIFWFTVAASARRPAWRWGVALLCAGALGGLLVGQRHVKPDVMAWVARVNWGADAILSRVHDPEAIAGVAPDVSAAMDRARFLEARHLSVFGLPEAGWLGRPLAEVATVGPRTACIGAFDLVGNGVELGDGGVRAAGWAWNLRDRREARRILLTDARLVIRGFGTAGVVRGDVPAANAAVRTGRPGWRGLARAANGETLRAFALLPDGAACEVGARAVGGLRALTAFAPLETGKLGGVIPTEARGEGVFLAEGAPPAVGVAPGPAYASWAGADSNTGAIAFGPFMPTTGAIAFGLVTGPDPTGEVVQVVDATTGEVLAEVAPFVRPEWRLVALPVQPGRAIRLVARDGGKGFGQWIGITTPLEVRP